MVVIVGQRKMLENLSLSRNYVPALNSRAMSSCGYAICGQILLRSVSIDFFWHQPL
jgi:hypothetical protein